MNNIISPITIKKAEGKLDVITYTVRDHSDKEKKVHIVVKRQPSTQYQQW